jgi:hypothetical protein
MRLQQALVKAQLLTASRFTLMSIKKRKWNEKEAEKLWKDSTTPPQQETLNLTTRKTSTQ